MGSNPRILVFIDWFYPAFKAGGPIKSVYNLIENLKAEFDFFVVTGDRDIDGTLVNQIDNIQFDQWIEKDGFEVIYLTSEKQNAKVFRELALEKGVDWTYFNSLFSKNFTLKPYRALKGVVQHQMIAPRGMLGKGALSIKPIKKQLFIKLSRALLFDRSTYWHATSEQEAQEIRSRIKTDNIRIAANLASALPESPTSIEKREGELKLFFLSRISQKKNLRFILNCLSELKDLSGIELNIYGPIEADGHWDDCLPIVEKDSRINYCGEIHPNGVPTMISAHHLLVLPTLHENYGHVIAETLSQGRPVLISDQTPWKHLEAKGIGYDLDLANQNDWINAIRKYRQMDQKSFNDQSERAFDYAKRIIVNSEVVEASKRLFATNE